MYILNVICFSCLGSRDAVICVMCLAVVGLIRHSVFIGLVSSDSFRIFLFVCCSCCCFLFLFCLFCSFTVILLLLLLCPLFFSVFTVTSTNSATSTHWIPQRANETWRFLTLLECLDSSDTRVFSDIGSDSFKVKSLIILQRAIQPRLFLYIYIF